MKVGATAATMVTLMACYGAAYPYPEPSTAPGMAPNDRDGDGFEAAPSGAGPSPAYDCDDTSKDVHPGADDPMGDALDQNWQKYAAHALPGLDDLKNTFSKRRLGGAATGRCRFAGHRGVETWRRCVGRHRYSRNRTPSRQ